MSSLSMSQASIKAVVIDGYGNMTNIAGQVTNALLLRSRKWCTRPYVWASMLRHHGLARRMGTWLMLVKRGRWPRLPPETPRPGRGNAECSFRHGNRGDEAADRRCDSDVFHIYRRTGTAFPGRVAPTTPIDKDSSVQWASARPATLSTSTPAQLLSRLYRAVGARPPRHGGGTRAIHRGRARRDGPTTPRRASGRGHHRSARHPRGSVGGATRAGRQQRRAAAGAAGDAVDTRRLNGLGVGHRRQDGGESAGQHRLARPWGTKEEDVVGRTPTLDSV
jgi:hypothetical protein